MKESAFEQKPIEVSVAELSDVEEIVRIQGESWVKTYPNEVAGITKEDVEAFILPHREAKLASWGKAIASPSQAHTTFVVREGQGLGGYCFIQHEQERSFINAIYLDPRAEGKGYGSALMKAAIAWADPQEPIMLHVTSYNGHAIAFYQRHGFEISPDPVAQKIELPSGIIIPLTKMVRPPADDLV